ncbi:hypothetical protein [Brevundimonas sp. SL161]|uniref:hypothetical protein n=1 Tax=Brevundimonas sp. SL161 TaxID=2804613 RepID=UPI003CF06890
MTYALVAIAGLLLAAMFDVATALGLNVYGVENGKQRHQAALYAFSVHGPFGAVAALWVSGALEEGLVGLGLSVPVAFVVSLLLVGGVSGLGIWLFGLIPAVREARQETKIAILRARDAHNAKWARMLGMVPREPKA